MGRIDEQKSIWAGLEREKRELAGERARKWAEALRLLRSDDPTEMAAGAALRDADKARFETRENRINDSIEKAKRELEFLVSDREHTKRRIVIKKDAYERYIPHRKRLLETEELMAAVGRDVQGSLLRNENDFWRGWLALVRRVQKMEPELDLLEEKLASF